MVWLWFDLPDIMPKKMRALDFVSSTTSQFVRNTLKTGIGMTSRKSSSLIGIFITAPAFKTLSMKMLQSFTYHCIDSTMEIIFRA